MPFCKSALPPLAIVLSSSLLCVAPACKGKKTDPVASQSTSANVSGSTSASAGPVDSAGLPVYQEGDRAPIVSLSGKGAGPSANITGPALGALAFNTPIYQRPTANSRLLGHLRAGAIVAVTGGPAGNEGCAGGWYPIAPFGFVCVGPAATLDRNHEVLKAVIRAPDIDSTLPYMYGIVRKPGPIYSRLPTRAEAASQEPGLDKHIENWLGATDDNGAAFRADYWLRFRSGSPSPDATQAWSQNTSDAIPSFLQGGRTPPGNLSGLVKDRSMLVVGQSKRHNGFAMVDTLLFEGRRYAITTDLVVLPVDRLRPIQGSTYHGYEIPKDIDFPFALIRVDGAFAYKAEKGKLSKAKPLPRRSAVKLTGKQNFYQGRLHYQTDEGLWISDKEASRLDPAKRMPAWGKNGERWLDVNVTKQTLVAYDGTKPVFATVVSTGEAGLGDPSKSKSTKRGIFRIHTKHISATMNSEATGEEFDLRDIPYVQYFEEGYALHAAYWHDDFGTPRSHGCINLAPEDARRLFFWTEPKIPPGWHSVLRPLTGSVIFVHP